MRHWDGWDDLLLALVCMAAFVALIIMALK
jgi:hypothetical protein